jgi:hypothetical protein
VNGDGDSEAGITNGAIIRECHITEKLTQTVATEIQGVTGAGIGANVTVSFICGI